MRNRPISRYVAEHRQLHDIGSVRDHDGLSGEAQQYFGGDGVFHDIPPAISAWPIGSVFISVVSTSPATLLGFGTWSAFGAGRVLIGLDSGDTDFDVVEETGGAKTVASSAQTFAGTQLGTHQHAAITAGTPAGTNGTVAASLTGCLGSSSLGTTYAACAHTHPGPTFTGTQMGTHQHAAITAGTPAGTNSAGAATSVVQPYICVYMWKRTA